MKVKALKSFTSEFSLKKGDVKEVPDADAAYYIRLRLVEEVKPKKSK